MKLFLILTAFCGLSYSIIEVLQPTELRSQLHSDNDKASSIGYSVSTFGQLPFSERQVVQVLYPGGSNENGCDSLKAPGQLSVTRFVWLFERGTCTYAKKTFESQQTGAYAVLVFHDDPLADIQNVIPCGDSLCYLIRH